MTELGSVRETIDSAPGFHPIIPDQRLTTQTSNNINIIQPKPNNIKLYTKLRTNITTISNNIRNAIKKPTIFSTGCIILHVCFGNFAIFSMAPLVQNFGLIWIIIFCIIVGFINYWTIMKSFNASVKCNKNNYSEITENFLGKKLRQLLNIIMIIYSFLCMMFLISLTFPIIGRVIQIILYNNKYKSYINFENQKWGKSFIKYPIEFKSYLILKYLPIFLLSLFFSFGFIT